MKESYKFDTGQQVTLKGGKYSRKGEVVFRFYSIHSIPMYLVEYPVSLTYPRGGTISYNEKNLKLYKEPSPQYLSADGEVLEVGDLVVHTGYLTSGCIGRISGVRSWGTHRPYFFFIQATKPSVRSWQFPSSDLRLIEKGRK